MGDCPACGELVWEDEWVARDDEVMHDRCQARYIKMKYGLSEGQFTRLMGAGELRQELAEVKKMMAEEMVCWQEIITSMEKRLAELEGQS